MARRNTFTCHAVLKQYPSERATWYVVTLDTQTGERIHQQFRSRHGGFRSLPVTVTLGHTTWQTSIFRDSRAKSYILFIKAKVRTSEAVVPGDRLEFTLLVGESSAKSVG